MTVIDGGGKVTLDGGGKIRILYMNTCDPKQRRRAEQHRRQLGRSQQRDLQRDHQGHAHPRQHSPGGEGSAVFFVVDAGHGTLTIEYSTLHHNPAGGYDNAPEIFDDVDQKVIHPTVIHSTIN